ncbi:MAG: 50S ribosomal protein L10 [Pseudomonadota bacterium]|nr:50S ribosomal protein L10 [Pseudomonadota bacterium]
MNLAEKQELVEQLQERMQRANACVLAEYQGLTVADLTKLRRSLYPHDGEFKIAKNRLVKIALQNSERFGVLREHMRGPVGITYLYGDLAQGIKQVLDFRKDNDKFKIKNAVMYGNLISTAMMEEIASLPSKEVLLARLVGTIVAPHRQLLTVLQGVPRSLVQLTAALRDNITAK